MIGPGVLNIPEPMILPITIDVDSLLQAGTIKKDIIKHYKKESVSTSVKAKIDQSMEYIKQNFLEDISREGLAAKFDLNPDYFGKVFKTITISFYC